MEIKTSELAKWIVNQSTKKDNPKSLLKIQKIAYFLIVDYMREFGKKLVSDFDFVINNGIIESKIIDRLFWHFGANPIIEEYRIPLESSLEVFLSEKLSKYLVLKPYELVTLQVDSKAVEYWKQSDISIMPIPFWIVKEERI